MNLKILGCIMLVLSVFIGCTGTPNTVSTDTTVEDTNNDLKISVASVAVSQVLSAMNQDIVGRPTTKLELPEEYVSIPEIGSSFSPDFEKVLEVGTQLLIGDMLFKDKIDDIAKQYGIDTFYIDTSTYDNFLSGIQDLGKKINKEAEATEIIDKFRNPINNLESIDKDINVAVIFGSSESNMLATKDTYIGSLVNAFGIKNIVDEILEANKGSLNSGNYVNLSIEQLLVNEPDIILTFGHGNTEETKQAFEKLFNENPAWKNLNAIKNNKIYVLESDIFGTSANIYMDKALIRLGEIFNAQ